MEREDRPLSKAANVIYVGRKPPMNYVLAVMTALSSDVKEVVLKARGRAITTAVDVEEITRRRFLKELDVKQITIGTEELPLRELEGTRAVSSIEIILSRSREPETAAAEDEKEAAGSAAPMSLTAIKGIGEDRAERLRAGGVNSITDLANVDPHDAAERVKISEKMLSEWSAQARSLLAD
jgi:DNA-binding protein